VAAAVAAFRPTLQRLVAERAISLREAFGFDLEYTAQRAAEERAHFETVSRQRRGDPRREIRSYRELVELSARYEAELAQDQRRIAEAARRETDKMAQP